MKWSVSQSVSQWVSEWMTWWLLEMLPHLKINIIFHSLNRISTFVWNLRPRMPNFDQSFPLFGKASLISNCYIGIYYKLKLFYIRENGIFLGRRYWMNFMQNWSPLPPLPWCLIPYYKIHIIYNKIYVLLMVVMRYCFYYNYYVIINN